MFRFSNEQVRLKRWYRIGHVREREQAYTFCIAPTFAILSFRFNQFFSESYIQLGLDLRGENKICSRLFCFLFPSFGPFDGCWYHFQFSKTVVSQSRSSLSCISSDRHWFSSFWNYPRDVIRMRTLQAISSVVGKRSLSIGDSTKYYSALQRSLRVEWPIGRAAGRKESLGQLGSGVTTCCNLSMIEGN